MLDEEVEALGLLAYKRGLFYESRKDSLRQDIDRLRNFLEAMAKDRELMQKQAKAEHILCKKKLMTTEKELQETQNRLRETENEAASLLDSKHAEMERLQKERDDALAKVEILCAESCFLKGYGNHLEQKVCALVVKLHEYHQQLQRKTEEVVQTRGRAVDEWEWVRQSMTSFQENLLEFQNTNAQLSIEKENYMKELKEMKQLERINTDKSNEGLAQAEQKLHCANQAIKGLQGKLQKLEYDFQSATQKAEAYSSQLEDANAKISELQDQIDKLHGQLEEMQKKNLDFMKDKLEANAATQLREAAISVLKLRIYALEGDLQKEVFLRTNQLPDSHLKYLTQFSPAIDVEVRAKPGIIRKVIQREGQSFCDFAELKLRTSENERQEDFEGLKRSNTGSVGLDTHFNKEQQGVLWDQPRKGDAWNTQKVRKLEQTLAEAHHRYMLLSQGQSFVQDTLAPKMPDALLQHAHSSTENGPASEDSFEIVNQFLTNRDSQHKSSSFLGGRRGFERFSEAEWIPQDSLDHPQAQTNYVNRRYNTPYDSQIVDDLVSVPLEGLRRATPRYSLDRESIYDCSSTEE